MKRIIGVLAAVLMAVPVASTPRQAPAYATEVAVKRVSPWKLVVNDQFTSGGVPSHWIRYDGPYGSDPHNCATPKNGIVSQGMMRMLFRWQPSGQCGAGWYSSGMVLDKRYQSVDQKIQIRFRSRSVDGIRAHWIIPMRWPSDGAFPSGGEEDYCEGGGGWGCSTFIHGYNRKGPYKDYNVNINQWHTWTFVRRNFTLNVFLDGRQVWYYRGNRFTLPPTLKRPVLQQECRAYGCPTGRTGSQTLIIDFIKVWNPR